MTPKEQKDLIRFFSHVRVCPKTGCWIWTGCRNADGYGTFHIQIAPYKKKVVYSHRWLYTQLIGEIEPGMHLDHIVCNTPACVHPLHLKVTTPTENDIRANNRRWMQKHKHTPATLLGDNENESPF